VSFLNSYRADWISARPSSKLTRDANGPARSDTLALIPSTQRAALQPTLTGLDEVALPGGSLVYRPQHPYASAVRYLEQPGTALQVVEALSARKAPARYWRLHDADELRRLNRRYISWELLDI
jgi:hypothetical protein